MQLLNLKRVQTPAVNSSVPCKGTAVVQRCFFSVMHSNRQLQLFVYPSPWFDNLIAVKSGQPQFVVL